MEADRQAFRFSDERGKVVSQLPIEVSAKDAAPSGGSLLARTILSDSRLSRSLLPPIIRCGFFCGRSAERIMPEVLLTGILPSEYIAH